MATLPMTAPEMMAEARQQTRISIVDEKIIVALEKLVDSFNRDGQPHDEGAEMLHQRIMRALCNRLRMARDIAAHPEILEQALRPPVFICGMARTGSTKTQKLLAASEDFNFFTYWKALNPSLYTGDPNESPQARIDEADRYARWFDSRSPETKKGHSFETFEPEEDSDVLGHSLMSAVWYGWAPLDSYLVWLGENDLRYQFEVLRDVLKYQQWQGLADPAKPWVLKCPLYSGLEHLLIEVFPDATLIMTHRSNTKTVGSGLKLLECFYQPFTHRRPDPEAYVQGVLGATQAHMQWRAQQRDDRFLDLPFSALVAQPEATIRAIYAYAQLSLSDASLERMLLWNDSNPQNKYGRHEYSLADYGLSPEGISETFRDYEDFIARLDANWAR